MFVFILYTENKHCLIIRVYTVTYCTCVPLTQKKTRRERERERGGKESLGRRKEGESWREGEGSYITDQRGVRGTVREGVCMWRV